MKHVFQLLRRSKAARIALFSYVAFGSNTICALVSIPLAVAFLGSEQIALWTLVSQLISYLVWMDLGVGDAIGRKIADPILHRNQSEIDAWWSLSIGLLSIQGILVLGAGAIVWPLWNSWFEISQHLKPDALWLFAAAVGSTALSLPMRAYPGMLLAQQRFVWVPISQCASPWVQMTVFATCLLMGLGVKSYFIGIFSGHLAGWTILLVVVHKGPTRVHLTRRGIDRTRFLDLLRYSGSVAINGLSTALTQTLPSLLLGRFSGFSLIPVYSFTARVPELLGNLSQRTTHAFYPGIQAHAVSGNRAAFIHKFREVQGLTLSLSLVVAAFILLANRSIISWLASPDFFAGRSVNLWFAVASITIPYSRSLGHLLQYSGDMGKSAAVSVLPLVLGAPVAWIAYHCIGMVGLAATFALLPLATTAPYAVVRGSRNIQLPVRTLCGRGILHASVSILIVLLAGWWCLDSPAPMSSSSLFGRSLLKPSTREWFAGCTLFLSATIIAFSCLRNIRSGFECQRQLPH